MTKKTTAKHSVTLTHNFSSVLRNLNVHFHCSTQPDVLKQSPKHHYSWRKRDFQKHDHSAGTFPATFPFPRSRYLFIQNGRTSSVSSCPDHLHLRMRKQHHVLHPIIMTTHQICFFVVVGYFLTLQEYFCFEKGAHLRIALQVELYRINKALFIS